MLKAWDLVNNSSTEILDFIVSKKEQLKIASVRNFPNPFKALGGNMVFAFEHNQPNTNLDVKIEIVNAAGTLIKQIRKSVNAQGTRNIELGWDGTNQTGRNCLPGIYYYCLSVFIASTPNVENQSIVGQIVIL